MLEEGTIMVMARSRLKSAFRLKDARVRPHVPVLHRGPEQWRIGSKLTTKARLQGRQFHDACIAANWVENDVSVL